MRIAAFRYEGRDTFGFVVGSSVIPAEAIEGLTASTVRELIETGLPRGEAVARATDSISLADVELLLPVQPNKILCAGVNFPTHRAETGRDSAKPAAPTIFARFLDSFVAHQQPLRKPVISDQFDYECELGIVIGQTARNVSVESALEHVFGYTCLNDGTMRDWQAHTAQWTPGKNWYHSGSYGPWIVSADAFGTPGPQMIQTRVNGQTRQSARLDEMIHSVAELIAYCSAFTPLEPGDVIACGTTGGVGKYMEPPGYLEPGDVVEVEIDGIGTLVNPVARENAN
jgi:2-keto-4-pentenoate hydratase/2-oxohepta-3-ene-1,7-dioic acid hydratase in catechol pathway